MAQMYEEIDRKRRDALAGGNAVIYFRYCNELGVEPENAELYEAGERKIRRDERLEKGLEKIAEVHPYDDFLREAQRGNLDVDNFVSRSNEKAEILKKYFARFQDKGKQSIDNYEPSQIGYIFRRIFDEAMRVVQKTRRA